MSDELIKWLSADGHSQQKLADLLTDEGERITQPAISQWIARGSIPAERVLAVSRVTGISPTKLRPDLYPARSRVA